MNSSFTKCLKSSRFAAMGTLLMIIGSSTSDAGMIIHSGDLLTVSTDNKLRSYSLAGTGTLVQTLQITGLGLELTPTGTAQGVSVLNSQLFIGLVSTNASFTPKIVEVDPETGAAINIFDTATPQITALGDDGTNLLLLDSVNTWDVYTYTTGGNFVSEVAMTRHTLSNFQMEGIDGDGSSIFMSANLGYQPIQINDTAGNLLSFFNTNVPTDSIRGLAYDPNDATLWVASGGNFHQFSQAGVALSTVTPGLGSSSVTGLEVISPSQQVVPEPGTLASLLSLVLFGTGAVFVRNRRAKQIS
ncbi:MAG: hypothetical protein WEB58_17680 [Planctomycetaceae bacterium]